MAHEVSAYLEQGFSAHIAKPIDRKKMAEVLSLYLDKKQSNVDIIDIPAEALFELRCRFIDSLAEVARQSQLFIDNQSWEKLASLAHQIKGAASMFDLPRLTELATQLENKVTALDRRTREEICQQWMNELRMTTNKKNSMTSLPIQKKSSKNLSY